MDMHRQGLHMCAIQFYKKVGLPNSLLTFWLAMVENTSQSMIPIVDTRWVAGSLNIIIVELFLPINPSPVDLGLPAIAWWPRIILS